MQRIVLDTNVALDCWVFDDAGSRPLRAALEAGRLRALRSPATEAEFADVIARPLFALDAAGQAGALAGFKSHAELVVHVDPAPPGLRCADPADQMFLDLACTARADLLITKDKLLLATAGRASRHGVVVCTPAKAVARLTVSAARRE